MKEKTGEAGICDIQSSSDCSIMRRCAGKAEQLRKTSVTERSLAVVNRHDR
ncbi:MAG: hypothetical protein Udaeo2_27550 [Candidatus Udaeobacter sp.]|nr:MAG: hypothetical protein Udaeo2_27550 [Candidatus Udaeobacter sp.]